MTTIKSPSRMFPEWSPDEEKLLIRKAATGDRQALEEIVRQFQPVIYNIALRMVYNQHDAEDITQEVLIKVITHIGTFNFDSSVYTWVYRITSNHFINMQKRPTEKLMRSFEEYGEGIDGTPDLPLTAVNKSQSEYDLILEEVKLQCFQGMLLCLNRRRRLAFILGEIFGLAASEGAEIMDLSPENFRQLLSRGRRQVYSFMRGRCGLVKKKNRCQCHLKAQTMINSEELVPDKLRFAREDSVKLNSLHSRRSIRMTNYLNKKCSDLFQDQSLYDSDVFVDYIRDLTQSKDFQVLFNLHD